MSIEGRETVLAQKYKKGKKKLTTGLEIIVRLSIQQNPAIERKINNPNKIGGAFCLFEQMYKLLT